MFILYECWIQIMSHFSTTCCSKVCTICFSRMNTECWFLYITNHTWWNTGLVTRWDLIRMIFKWLGFILQKHWSYVWKLKSHFIIKIQVIFDIKWYCTPISIIFTHARRQIHNSQKQPYQKYSTKHSWLEHFTHHSDSIVSRARTQKVDKNLDTTIT